MKATYQLSLVWFLVAILMMPLAYGQNETILVANFMNGNNAFLNSRVYLFNSSDTAGGITVRVFSLPLRSGVPQELTVAPFSLGTLGARSALNVKLAEDILTPLGIPIPYITDGGNLTVEFTVGAEKVRGVAQVFTSDFAFGTYPLQGPGGAATSGEIPDGSVTSSKIANGAVGSAQLADQVDFGATGSRGLVRMLDSTGTVVTEVGASTADDGVLVLYDTGGNMFARIRNSVGLGGVVETYSPTGVRLALMGITTTGHGFIETTNSTGNDIVRITTTSGSGFISVRDSSGTQTAGINGSTGDVFGTTKSFIVADPSNSDRLIKYTSLEGPEAAIYVRGTANLVSGQGYIEFPDHFSAMAAPSSITVTLTPRSARSMGLAAVNVSSQGIEVAELGGGRNSYTFDYVAYAVRKGFEDYEVYMTKDQAGELTGQTPRLVEGLAPPVQPKKALE